MVPGNREADGRNGGGRIRREESLELISTSCFSAFERDEGKYQGHSPVKHVSRMVDVI
jgi:hypothetical protein